MTAGLAVLCVLAILALAVLACIRRIPEGQVYTLQRRHDAQVQLLTPGTHWIVPLRDHVAHKISLTGRTLQMNEILADGRSLNATVYWQVLNPAPADAVIDRADALIREHVHACAIDHADPCNADLKASLNHALRERGLLVTRVDAAIGAAMSAAA